LILLLLGCPTKETKLAPAYDCGSSVYARIDGNTIPDLLANDEEINNLSFKLPIINGKKEYNFILLRVRN